MPQQQRAVFFPPPPDDVHPAFIGAGRSVILGRAALWELSIREGREFHGRAIDAIAKSSRPWPIPEDMTEMPIAMTAVDTRTGDRLRRIARCPDRVAQGLPEARPPRAAVEFRSG